METESFNDVKNGLMLYLLGSDKLIIESLQPNPVNQEQALENQFQGKSDEPFDYVDFEATRKELMQCHP